MGRGLGGLCPQRGLGVLGAAAAFVFGAEAVVRLSPVFVAVAALHGQVSFIATALRLGRRVQPVVILWIKPSSLAIRRILQEKKRGRCQMPANNSSRDQANHVSKSPGSCFTPRTGQHATESG